MTISVWFNSFWKSLYDEFFGEPVTYPFLRRVLAFIIDALIFAAFTSLISFLVYLTGASVDIFYFLGFNLTITTLYFSLLNSKIGNGKTIGKRIFNLKVTDEEGNLIDFWRSLIRSLPLVLILTAYDIILTLHMANVEHMYVVYASYICLIGVVYFSVAKQNRQGLHDLLAGTQVVSKAETFKTKKNLTVGLVLGYALTVAIVVYLTFF